MLKIGKIYKPKRRTAISPFFAWDGIYADFITQDEFFTVVDFLTDEEETNEYSDYVILYNGGKYILTLKKCEWKTDAYDFEVVC